MLSRVTCCVYLSLLCVNRTGNSTSEGTTTHWDGLMGGFIKRSQQRRVRSNMERMSWLNRVNRIETVSYETDTSEDTNVWSDEGERRNNRKMMEGQRRAREGKRQRRERLGRLILAHLKAELLKFRLIPQTFVLFSHWCGFGPLHPRKKTAKGPTKVL